VDDGGGIAESDVPELQVVLVDEGGVGVVVDEVSDEEVVVGIDALALHQTLLLETDVQVLVDFDYGLADAVDTPAAVLQKIAAEEDCAADFAHLAVHIHFGLGVAPQKHLYFI